MSVPTPDPFQPALALVELASIAVQTAVVDVLASGEFCNPRRRLAHLLTMYGFILYLVTTILMVYVYPTAATPRSRICPLSFVRKQSRARTRPRASTEKAYACSNARRSSVIWSTPRASTRGGSTSSPTCGRSS